MNDLFRRTLNKGRVGVYSELQDNLYIKIQDKLISLYGSDQGLKFTRCTKLAIDLPNEEELCTRIEKVHIDGNHRGILENFEKIKDLFFYPNIMKYINKFINS